jgi:PKD repeat protein
VKPDLPPTADLTVDKTTILKGDTVKFDASDSKDPEGKILLYLFDWGDSGKSSFQDQPKMTHKYATTGTFDAIVTVKDPSEHTAMSEAVTIVVGAAPVGKITLKSVSCTVGEPCEFDASGSTDEDGTIASYSYDFGGSEASGWVTTSNISHVFTTPGAHTVKLKVKDDTGFESTNIAQVDVTVADKASGGGGGSSSSGMGGSLLPLLLIIVIVVVVVAVVLMMRRKKPAPTPPAQPQPQFQPVAPPPPGYAPPAQPEPQPQQPPQYGYDQPYQYQQQPQEQAPQYDYSQQQQAYAEQPQEQVYTEQPRAPAFSYDPNAYQSTPTQ